MEKQKAKTTSQADGKRGYTHNPLVQPFLKWAGGKRQLMPVLKKVIPQHKKYYEPFVGAGALFFSLQAKESIINDTNSELINCYQVIRDHPDELLARCQEHETHNSKEYYYRLRNQDRQPDFTALSSIERAARILYLNKTCFNGLFRVNSQGQFNVPYGHYLSPVVADPAVIHAVSHFLNVRSVKMSVGDFAAAVMSAGKGDFVYCDPPYHPISDTSSFTGYSINGFGENEQKRLREVCDQLSDRGCSVLVSNSNAPFIRDLYADSRYSIVEVDASRAINSIGTSRGKLTELLIHNHYECQSIEKQVHDSDHP